MTTKTMQYAHQSLAACGFAVMRSTVAWQLRPDLWASAQECGTGFSPSNVEGAERVIATLSGVGEALVLTRSMDRLAERIEWVTGHKVERLANEGDRPQAVVASDAVPPRRNGAQPAAFDNISTKESPRSCSSCDHLTAGHSCAAVRETGLSNPSANTPRRCLSYRPKWGADDDRSGRQLWPEIVNFVELGEGAKGFLATALIEGPVSSSEIISTAAAAGISERSIQRAAEQLGVMREKVGFSGGWIWSMPETEGAKA
jgi:hypothetical protein